MLISTGGMAVPNPGNVGGLDDGDDMIIIFTMARKSMAMVEALQQGSLATGTACFQRWLAGNQGTQLNIDDKTPRRARDKPDRPRPGRGERDRRL